MDSCMLDTPGGGIVDQGTIQKGTPYTRDAKRQKMLDYGSSATVVMGNCLTQKVDSSSNGAISNCNLAVKPEEQPCIAQPTPVSNSSDLESVCAFCHSSKLTDVSSKPKHNFV